MTGSADGPARGRTRLRSALDDIDRGLLDGLREDGRMPLATLGQRVALSGDAVRERLREMTRRGMLQVTCSVDPTILGYGTLALVGITLSGPAEPVADSLALVPELDLVGCVTGRYDILVEAVCRDEEHLMSVLDDHIRSLPDVTSTVVFSYLDVLKFNPGGTSGAFRPDTPHVELSDNDRAIIAALHQDGRASYQDVAATTGLPYQVARRRTKHLLDTGVVRVETLVNRLAEGAAVVAAVGLTTSGPISAITPAILAIDEIEVAVVSAGPFDLFLEVVCRDRHHLSRVVSEQIRAIPGVQSTETSLYQRLVKLPQSWSGLVDRLGA